MKKILTHNTGLKLVSLGLAIMTWFYIYTVMVKTREVISVPTFEEDPVEELKVDRIDVIK